MTMTRDEFRLAVRHVGDSAICAHEDKADEALARRAFKAVMNAYDELVAERDALRTGVPLTLENAPRARVVECCHCAFIVGVGDDGNKWWCNGWGVDLDYLLRMGATVLAWRNA